MVKLHYKNKTYNIPTEWNELNVKQLIGISGVLHSKVEETKGRLMILRKLAGMSWWTFFKFPQDELAQLTDLTNFVLTKNTLTRQLLPHYRGLYGPDSELANLKMNEFVFAELFFSEYKNEENNAARDKLIAVLYRRAKKHYDKKLNKDGDVRRDFNANLIERDALTMQGWPVNVKQAIVLWYAGCREAWAATYENVLGGSGGAPSKYGMYSIIRNVAKDNVFGNFEEVEQQYVNTILMHLDETITEAQEIEKQYKK